MQSGRNSGASNELLKTMNIWPHWGWKHSGLNMEVKQTQLPRIQDSNH